MRMFPIDTARLGVVRGIEVRPDTDQNGEAKRSQDGVPVWVVEVLHHAESGRAEVERVKVVAADAPTVMPLAPVRFVDLVARPWQLGSRSGVALFAAAVEAAPIKAGERA